MSESLREQIFGDLERVMDRLNCGLAGSDPDGVICFVNRNLLNLLGYGGGELTGVSTVQLVPPEIRERLTEEREAFLTGDIRMRLTVFQRKDSTTLPVLIVPQRILDDEGEAIGTFTLILDMGSVETAKPIDYRTGDDVHERLERIARELQAIGLATRLPTNAGLLPLDHPELAELTPREREILAYLMGGKRVPAIAKQLFISQDTVRSHLKSTFRKLGVSNQSDLVQHVLALRGF